MMARNFGDHGYPLRQEFIKDYLLVEKINLLRQHFHNLGFALLTEEVKRRVRGRN